MKKQVLAMVLLVSAPLTAAGPATLPTGPASSSAPSTVPGGPLTLREVLHTVGTVPSDHFIGATASVDPVIWGDSIVSSTKEEERSIGLVYQLSKGEVLRTDLQLHGKDKAGWIKEVGALGEIGKDKIFGMTVALSDGLKLRVSEVGDFVSAGMWPDGDPLPFTTTFKGIPICYKTNSTDLIRSLVKLNKTWLYVRFGVLQAARMPIRLPDETTVSGRFVFMDRSLDSVSLEFGWDNLSDTARRALAVEVLGEDAAKTDIAAGLAKIARTEKVDGRLVVVVIYPKFPDKSTLTLDLRSTTEEELKLGYEIDAIERRLLDPSTLAKLSPAEQKARKDAVEAAWRVGYGTRERVAFSRKVLDAFRQLATSFPTTTPTTSRSAADH
jgi:hypothetical protein